MQFQMKHFCFKHIIPVTGNLQLHKSYLSHDVLGMISCLNVLTPSSGSQPFFELSALPALVQSGGICFRKVACLFFGGTESVAPDRVLVPTPLHLYLGFSF